MANIISKIATPTNNSGYAVRSGFMYYGTTTGNGANYNITIQEAESPFNTISVEAYYDGLVLAVRFHTAPTSDTPTLRVNSLNAIQIKYENGASPRYKIVPGAVYILVYTTVGSTGYFYMVHSYGSGTFYSGKNVLTSSSIGTTNSTLNTENMTTYLNHVENGSVTNEGSLQIKGTGAARVEARGGVLTIYSAFGGQTFSSSSFGTVNSTTTNSNTYLNFSQDGSVTSGGSLRITGSGSTTVSANEGVLTINSTGGGGTHYVGKNVFANSANSASNATSATSNSSTYLNHVENSSVTSGGSLAIIGSGNTTVSAKNGTLTITSTNGTGPAGSTVSYQSADYGVMGAFVGLLDIDNNTYPLAVQPARVDIQENDKYFSRQGVSKPFMESINMLPSVHRTDLVWRNNHGIFNANELGDSKYVFDFGILLESTKGSGGFIAIPVLHDYCYNEYTMRYESVPYIVLPSKLSASDGTSLGEFFGEGDSGYVDGCKPNSGEPGNSANPRAPLLDFADNIWSGGSILDGYRPPRIG